jgi:hypothetical protein
VLYLKDSFHIFDKRKFWQKKELLNKQNTWLNSFPLIFISNSTKFLDDFAVSIDF